MVISTSRAVECGGSTSASVVKWLRGLESRSHERVAREAPVALVYNGVSHAVMMATPVELDEFAIGFSLTEGVIQRREEIYDIQVSEEPLGFVVAIELSSARFVHLRERRRALAGRTGCGLCGKESLAEFAQPLPPVTDRFRTSGEALQSALGKLAEQQALQSETGATHAAAWVYADGTLGPLREDVGRHNALDKLIGALGGTHSADPSQGFVLTSSRASYEMVAKSVVAGIELLAAISAPTSLAIELAETAGLTLVGFTRQGRHTVYSHPERLH